ncbi:putative carnitinyl-CoA dehydratase [Talaromyces proteolyticus]|uniref:Carnitinyl-CoA dehydratase n=1 Tax=Talaromyces proteolyticus TaxID=1131652 RepID=A0AAD4PUX5_9EURO|nr:putative carnitinyl-CoA dehydratase [Talaromyces proteolyticus]KAH8695636.1 putative carnitinyl-CoA dehydratase [Talaromyces proteolyticus]
MSPFLFLVKFIGTKNLLNIKFSQRIIAALDAIRQTIGAYSDGALITRGNNTKFIRTVYRSPQVSQNSLEDIHRFYPLLHAIMDLPFPTIAPVTEHTFCGGCSLALAHDYRTKNAERGFISRPLLDLEMHSSGIGVLPKRKLSPQATRKMLLEGDKFTRKEALEDRVVDFTASPEQLLDAAVELANK